MSRPIKLGIAGLAAATAVAGGGVAVAAATSSVSTYGSGSPVVYHAIRTYEGLTLGPPSNATTVLVSQPLKPGWYLVNYHVGMSVAPDDNVVCAAAPNGNGNDGDFATAGNSGSTGIYADASAVDTIQITTTGEDIAVTCASNNNLGSTVGSTSLTAMKIGKLAKQIG